MEKKPKQANIEGIAVKVVALLKPLTSENRQRVISATLTLLGEGWNGTQGPSYHASRDKPHGGEGTTFAGLPARAVHWMKQNGISADQMEQVFDVAGDAVTVIASDIPGKNNKEKTLNTYVLQGISRLLASGEPTFDDEAARKACEGLGCYDSTNHSKYLAAKGNLLAGSKATGWKVTSPGLAHGAKAVKELTKKEE